MLSVPLTLFRAGDAPFAAEIRACSKPPKLASAAWLAHVLVGFGAQLGDHKTLSVKARGSYSTGSRRPEETLTQCSGDDGERPASSPCPSSSSSSSDDSSSGASSSSSESSSGSENEAPPPPANNGGNEAGGNGGDDQKKKKDDDGEGDGNSSDSSSDSSAAEDSDQEEEDDGVLIDTDDEKTGLDPTDEDMSGESDGSSDLENSYPRLPSAPVDNLIVFRQQAAHKELQLTEKLKKEVIADAKQRQRERREQTQRSKQKKKAPQSKRRHSKQSDAVSNGSMHLERHHANGSTGTTDANMVPENQQQGVTEDEWMVDCSCGLKEKNYDDGTSMIQCDSCSHWVHAKCADKQPEAVAQEKFLCFQCSWMFDCVCDVRRRPNHDDGQRMVECESCKTWQHTMCVGIPMAEEPRDDYRCPRCVKKGRRRKSSSSKGSGSRERQRKRSHAEPPRHHQKSRDASPVVAVEVRSSACSVDDLTSPTRSHRIRRADAKQSPKTERKTPLAQMAHPPPVPAVSPPSTPPPPPSTPPPPSAVSSRASSRSSRRDRSHGERGHGHLKRRSERERERSDRPASSSSSSHRKRNRPSGSTSPSSKTHSESRGRENDVPPPAAVTPSPRGKGLMLRGYSPSSAKTNTPSSRSVDVRPPLPLTPPSGGASSGHNYNSHGGRKRKVSSARDRLAKKLKIKKSSLR